MVLAYSLLYNLSRVLARVDVYQNTSIYGEHAHLTRSVGLLGPVPLHYQSSNED